MAAKGEVVTKELAVAEKARELAVRPDPYVMIQAMIAKGVTPENAEAFKTLCGVAREMKADSAREDFFAAKAALQAELPPVFASQTIPGKDGRIRSRFAPYEEIMAIIQPFLVRHGFSVSFTSEADEKRMTVTCTLSHVGGHSESNKFAVRSSGGPPGCSDAQADGSNHSYARRYALCDALNITIDKDTDARIEGAYITAETAKKVEASMKAAGLEQGPFLALADADSFQTIREGKLDILRRVISDAKKRPATPTNPEPGEEEPDKDYLL
jgi:hypothetical protein